MRRRFASIAVIFVAATSAAMIAGCTPLRAVELGCVDDDDCPAEQRCSVGVCTAGPVLGEGEGEDPVGEGEGENPGEGEGENPVGEGEGETPGEGEGETPIGEGEGEGEPLPPITASIELEDDIEQNSTTTVTWSSTEATECTLRADGAAIATGTAGDIDIDVLAARIELFLECRRPGGGASNSGSAFEPIIPRLPDEIDWRNDLRSGSTRRRYRVEATLRYPHKRRQAAALPLDLRAVVGAAIGNANVELDSVSVVVDGSLSFYDEEARLLFMRTPTMSSGAIALEIYVDDGDESDEPGSNNVAFEAPDNHPLHIFAADDFDVLVGNDADEALSVFGARFGPQPVVRSDVLDGNSENALVGSNAARRLLDGDLFIVRVERSQLPGVRQYVLSARDVDAARVVVVNGRNEALSVARLARAFNTFEGRRAGTNIGQLTLATQRRATTIATTLASSTSSSFAPLAGVTQLARTDLETNWANGTLVTAGTASDAFAAQSWSVPANGRLQHLIVHNERNSDQSPTSQRNDGAALVANFDDIVIETGLVWNLAP